MIRQCMLLCGLQLRKSFGINEIIYGKDENKKTRQVLFLFLYILVGIMLAGYTAGAALLLCYVGASALVPVLTVTLPGVVVFVFALFRSGPVLFEKGDLEILSALPICPSVLVTARIFSLYQGAFALTLGTALPAGLIYMVMEKAGPGYLLLLMAGLPFMTLLPLTAACILGTFIMAASALVRHTRIITLLLSLAATVALVCGAFFLGFQGGSSEADGLASMLEAAVLFLERLYPPAALYAAGTAGKSLPAFLGYVGLSAGVFSVFVWLVQKKFGKICDALHEKNTGSRFRMGKLRCTSPLYAVYEKELRRYFASNVYVTNTLFAWLLMLAVSVACMVLGPEKMTALIRDGMELTAQEAVSFRAARLFPCLFAFLGAMGNTTAVSLSMEGRNLWIMQTLPLSMQTLGLAKILVNLTMAVPALLLSALFLVFGGWKVGIAVILVPLCQILFSAVFGLWMNRLLPNLEWNSEAEVVKRSGSIFLTSMAGMFTAALPVAAAFLPEGGWFELLRALPSAAILLAAVLLFRDFGRRDLRGMV